MIFDGSLFRAVVLQASDVTFLGTPRQLQTFLDNRHGHLFDLDGTLVDTELAYVNVWKKLLQPFRLEVDADFFSRFIRGQNDDMALRKLCGHMSSEQRAELSARKEGLFDVSETRLVPGAREFVETRWRYGDLLAIVTNCNRPTAEALLERFEISKFFNAVVIGNECPHAKPFPDPYSAALKALGLKSSACTVWEDSPAGITSGRGIFPKHLVGIATSLSKDELMELGCTLVIRDFLDQAKLDVEPSQRFQLIEMEIRQLLSEKLGMKVRNIVFPVVKAKGGYIADVLELKIALESRKEMQVVLKLENQESNPLLVMAKRLDLYEREYFFYEKMSSDVPVRVPKFVGLIRHGILLENLYQYPGVSSSMNMEETGIDSLLPTISAIAGLHIRYWGCTDFPELKLNEDFKFIPEFLQEKWGAFERQWERVLSEEEITMGRLIVENYQTVLRYLSAAPQTVCHGDCKAANMFFDGSQPIFLDWQYVMKGKGTQDLVFFLLESFSISKRRELWHVCISYYHTKLIQSGISYADGDFQRDLKMSAIQFPVFVAVWFGTTSIDHLIDKNFPFFFVTKTFALLGDLISVDWLRSTLCLDSSLQSQRTHQALP
jgi:HAD superfamily hydrolase (TIGR01509 family)